MSQIEALTALAKAVYGETAKVRVTRESKFADSDPDEWTAEVALDGGLRTRTEYPLHFYAPSHDAALEGLGEALVNEAGHRISDLQSAVHAATEAS